MYIRDDLGRLEFQQEYFGQGFADTRFEYDNFSRPLTTKFHDGTYVKQFYSTRGVHYKTQDITNGSNKTLWQLQSTIDARGNYRYSTLGNGVGIRHTYDPVTGALTKVAAGVAGTRSFQCALLCKTTPISGIPSAIYNRATAVG